MGKVSTVHTGSTGIFVWVCMGPVVLFLLIVAVAPVTLAIVDSFRELSLTSLAKRGQFIGLQNYRDLIGADGNFYAASGRAAIFVLAAVPVELALGLLIALWLDRTFPGRRLVLTILMIPTMIAPVVVGMIWRFFLLPSFGILTVYMNRLGFFEEDSVFSGPVTAFVALIVIDIWEWTPFVMLIMLAGLAALPRAPIEAATIDGASRWQIFRHIQLPMLTPLIVVAAMLRAIDASKIFDTVYVLTGGGPGDATEVISTFAYRTNFVRWDLGYGAAVCLVLAFVSLVVAALFFKIVSGGAARAESA